MSLQGQLERLVGDLDAVGARYALVGGLAVSARAEPRFTRDVDVAVAVAEDRQAEHLVNALIACGYTVLLQVEEESHGRLASVRLAPVEPESYPAAIDLQFAASGIEEEIVRGAEPIDLAPGLEVPVARLGHLLALKLLAVDDERRPQDRLDIWALLRVAGQGEMTEAEQALRLVGRRGFHRGRDLLATLARFVKPD